MTKLLVGLLGAGVIATGGWAAASSLDADPARTVSLPGATTEAATTADTTTADTTTAQTTTAQTTTDDVSGPCDEAEHARDPRCTGGAPAGGDDDDRDDDRSGRRGGDDREDDEDRSGSNSGKG